MSTAAQIASEQAHVDHAYRSLDAELAHSREQLSQVLAQPTEGSTALSERDSEIQRLNARISALQNAERNLCFGRIDYEDGERLHIGRTGISDGDRRLVIDWRAPAAEPFYAATAREPLGVVRRRHLTIAKRRVIGIDDDLLDPTAAVDDVVGEGALLRALCESRDGRMRDAVATLQTEQDAIVRAPLPGVLVIQGAPGTGKTVVALHRAAYVLYRSPELLRRGVLIIGPNARFLDYISEVLPALGETNIITTTIEGLYPGHQELQIAAPHTARTLGDARMASALKTFIVSLQGASGDDGHHFSWDGEYVHIARSAIERCAEAARKTRELHNIARATFVTEILDELTSVIAQAEAARIDQIDEGLDEELGLVDSWLEQNPDSLLPRRLDDELAEEEHISRRQLRVELEHDAGIQRDIDNLWPYLTPEDAVRRLLQEGLSTRHTPHLTSIEIDRLAESAETAWTVSHIPLLDEAAEYLGSDDSAALAAAERDRQRQLALAQQVIGSDPALAGWISAEALAERNVVEDHRDLSQRALADRTWTYGHVIVDEAQELTPMQWRMIARRCPTRSMTIVGDIAQTSTATRTTSWGERLAELRAEPRFVELTICYRSPRELVEAVEPLLHVLRPDARPIDAVRASGHPPELIDGDIDDIEQTIRWVQQTPDRGQQAVITPDPERIIRALERQSIVNASSDDLRTQLVVLTPPAAKGLEFDHVLVHAPNTIAAEHGLPTLYVALTRSTGTLTVVQQGTVVDHLGSEWQRKAGLTGSMAGERPSRRTG